jgi:hypothetical protein
MLGAVDYNARRFIIPLFIAVYRLFKAFSCIPALFQLTTMLGASLLPFLRGCVCV